MSEGAGFRRRYFGPLGCLVQVKQVLIYHIFYILEDFVHCFDQAALTHGGSVVPLQTG